MTCRATWLTVGGGIGLLIVVVAFFLTHSSSGLLPSEASAPPPAATAEMEAIEAAQQFGIQRLVASITAVFGRPALATKWTMAPARLSGG